MAIIKINPTRINLLRLKKDLKTAEKGYKLLKDKRDGLMKKFMTLISEVKKNRLELEDKFSEGLRIYARGASSLADKSIKSAFMIPAMKNHLEMELKPVMSVPLPTFSLKSSGQPFSYGFLESNGEIDHALDSLHKLLPGLVGLAEKEKAIESLALEIEKTRRRTSALENTMIPNLKETIRFITMRLEEQARDATVSTMRVKAMIVAKEEN